MVKLPEYQGKAILKKEGLKIPKSELISSINEIGEMGLRFPAVVKAQILTTGRLKLGAIRVVESFEEMERETKDLLGREFKGFRVEKVLIEEKIDYDDEFYLSILVNDSFRVRAPEIIFSLIGGVDIESIAERSPENILRITVDYLNPEDTFVELEKRLIKARAGQKCEPEKIVDFIRKAYDAFVKYDARILEINPIFLSKGELIAGDCKITIDDSSAFRHSEFGFEVPRDMHRPPTRLERIAWKIEENDYRGTAYFIQLNGSDEESRGSGYIAFHGIGGGASMLAADALIRKGLILANYADSSGNPPASKVYRLIRVIMAQKGIEGYVMMGAVFASQEQWHHAHALVKAFRELEEENPDRMDGFPVIVLLAGNKEKESHEILRKEFAKMGYNFELFGRDYIYKPELIAERVVEAVKRYRVVKRWGERKMNFEGSVTQNVNRLEIQMRTGRIVIDLKKCEKCESYECVKACSLYGRSILRIKNGKPVTFLSDEECRRKDNECLACEIHCPYGAVKAVLDFPELESFVKGG